jgi:hypothetical protein
VETILHNAENEITDPMKHVKDKFCVTNFQNFQTNKAAYVIKIHYNYI